MSINKIPDNAKQAKNCPLDQTTTYHINGRSFVVQPVFKQENAIPWVQFCFALCKQIAKKVCDFHETG